MPDVVALSEQTTMAVVKVEPAGVTFETLPGETVMTAAIRLGMRWPTVCGGHGECGACVMRVDHGADSLSPPGPAERQRLAELTVYTSGNLRLACQAVPGQGPIVVRRTGVRPAVSPQPRRQAPHDQ